MVGARFLLRPTMAVRSPIPGFTQRACWIPTGTSFWKRRRTIITFCAVHIFRRVSMCSAARSQEGAPAGAATTDVVGEPEGTAGAWDGAAAGDRTLGQRSSCVDRGPSGKMRCDSSRTPCRRYPVPPQSFISLRDRSGAASLAALPLLLPKQRAPWACSWSRKTLTRFRRAYVLRVQVVAFGFVVVVDFDPNTYSSGGQKSCPPNDVHATHLDCISNELFASSRVTEEEVTFQHSFNCSASEKLVTQ
jgi:hypothetical protein